MHPFLLQIYSFVYKYFYPNVLFQKKNQKQPPLSSFRHAQKWNIFGILKIFDFYDIACYAVIDIKVSKNYGTYLIFGSKKTQKFNVPCGT
ncbi:hypothetical protein DRJ17_00670 [Candidatus Woesearchaeota archaeon]|nr:MAG: hypothetical protein DRJ17_00670 [Candidatus Woesearchaeota archaeon]